MNRLTTLFLVTFLCQGAVAGDADAGRAKAAICAGCHGPDGISINELWPNLAAQKEAYLIKSLTDYRDGGRVEANMSPMAQNLSDEDIADLAAFYASQKPGGAK